MPSALDLRIAQALAKLTDPGAPMALTTIERFGTALPMIAAAPPALSHYFAHFCAQHGDADFLVEGDERLSFTQTYAAARKVAGALVEGWGVKRGDRVGIAMRNAPGWIVSYMGVIMAGGVATLLNGWWQGCELADGIRDTGTKLVLADPPRVKRLAECDEDSGATLVSLDVSLPIDQAIAPLLARGGGADTPLPELTGDDLATILFTSGSTGQSKGAYSDHRGVVQGTFNYLAITLAMLDLVTQDGKAPSVQPCTLLNVPLFHVTAEIPVMLQSFAMGRKLVLMPKWDAEDAMRLMAREKATYFVGVPLMSFEIMTHPNRAQYDLSTVASFAAGGAARPPEHVKRLEDEMGGAHPLLGYGLTETNAVGCSNINENYLAKPNSTGPASKPLVELAILDDAGQSLPQGDRGEVCIRTICNFLGYWNNEAATQAAITSDGFFRTGDIGYLDEDGYLFIVDRKKDIIIRGGENISCQEVEAAIYAHEAVAEAAVFGLPDARFGEVPGAVIHLKDHGALDVVALLDFLKTRLAPFKLPARVWLVADPLPRLGTEKIDKVSIRAAYRKLATLEGVG
ncbi:class I adenylate-forming enzyme family protein [Sphingobium boeckii]|uniref:Acyl-CoA synthetase (AMP-forming)/AMP-acid ligase II n=1 Tax=Sphingobium boeckii TaxID=1082345 RepID=A0A7W9AIV9_9SPHN|nr:class I adenylate-forming enzyme family protein [Sphingobium boeckii]MBB5686292.1 acyl-CoA synthetase (AMP-forming)/AMP-acid ligase II [Sphingobium boeckii]